MQFSSTVQFRDSERDMKVYIRHKPDRVHLLLYYVHPVTGRERSKSAGTADKREAERAAARWEDELKARITPANASWEAFRKRFEQEHFPTLTKHSQIGYGTALNHFERLIGRPTKLAAVDASLISQFAALMRKDKMGERSIGTHLGHIRAALRWAASIGMIQVAPTIKLPRIPKRKFNRGRSLTSDEVAAMETAVPDVVGEQHAPEWLRMLRGLRLCGLRLSEALRLSWDSPPARVDLDSGKYPRVIWFAEGHKARRDEAVPMTPDFADFLRLTPKADRVGRVFKPTLDTRTITVHYAGLIISEIGKKAGVVVNDKGKHASAHDLRRTFGTYWALKVRPLTLQALMRHQSLETTLRYYVDLQCDDVGAELWGTIQLTTQPQAEHSNAH